MGKEQVPERNRHGLVVPPQPAKTDRKARQRYSGRTFVDRHHLYWPRFTFREAGGLAQEFADHRFNIVWLPRYQHDRYHGKYDPFVVSHPDILIPNDDVMATFLDEARLLDELDVCVKAIDMMDEAIYEGRVKNEKAVLENRGYRLEVARDVSVRAQRFEIVTPAIANAVLQNMVHIESAA